MNTDERVTDENAESTDTDKSDDSPVVEQNNDMKSDQESPSEQVDDDSAPGENGDDLKTETEPIETAEPEPPSSEPDPEYRKVLVSVDEHLSNLQELFARQIAGNQNQKEMFDKVYIEMKAYKENTLMEAFHKPIADNLIRLYDNLVWVESELNGISEIIKSLESLFEGPSEKQVRDFFWKHLKKTQTKESVTELLQLREKLGKELSQFRENLEKVRDRLEEVLFRMNVKPYEAQLYAEQPIKLDRELHRTVDTIQTDNPEQDFIIAKFHKKGFLWREKVLDPEKEKELWRERVLRPEEVIIYRHIPPVEEPKETVGEKPTDQVGEKPTDQEGDKADG